MMTITWRIGELLSTAGGCAAAAFSGTARVAAAGLDATPSALETADGCFSGFALTEDGILHWQQLKQE